MRSLFETERRQQAVNDVTKAPFFEKMDKSLWPVVANEISGPMEVLEWDLFSKKEVTGETTSLYFFDHSEGSAWRGDVDTNMQASGVMPGNRIFIINGLALTVEPRARELWRSLAERAALYLRISDKQYRHTPCSIVPMLDTRAPIKRRVTREWKVPGKAMMRVVEEESTTPLLAFDPHLVILPLRPFHVLIHIRSDASPRTHKRFTLGCVLTGWDLRAAY